MSRPIVTNGGEVSVCEHAIERYIERVKPAFSRNHAMWELARLLPSADVSESVPSWLGENPEEHTDCKAGVRRDKRIDMGEAA